MIKPLSAKRGFYSTAYSMFCLFVCFTVCIGVVHRDREGLMVNLSEGGDNHAAPSFGKQREMNADL